MTPTTEVRYGEPVEIECPSCDGDGEVSAQPCDDCEGSGKLSVRFAFEDCPDCPEGSIDGAHIQQPYGRVICASCEDANRWGIPAGHVRVRCTICGGAANMLGYLERFPPMKVLSPALYERAKTDPCPEISVGRCYEGYAVEVAP